ncbi:MAG: 4-alpha-glucanotransferase [Candidatus Omnitrophota bacterium]
MFFRKRNSYRVKITTFIILQCFIIINSQSIFAQEQRIVLSRQQTSTLSPHLSIGMNLIQAIFSEKSQQPIAASNLPGTLISLRDTGSIKELLSGKDVFLNDLWARKTLGVPTAISSLRSEDNNFDLWDWGKGDMGESSRQHILWLAKNGFSRWMRLPNRKTRALFGDPSPYASRSAFAGEDSDIAVPEVEEFINSKQAQAWYEQNKNRIKDLHNANRVNGMEVARLKNEALWLAMEYFKENHLNKNTSRGKAFDSFLNDKDNDWVSEYAEYMAISEYYWDTKKAVFFEINEDIWSNIDQKLKGLVHDLNVAISTDKIKDVGRLYEMIDDFFAQYYQNSIVANETDIFRLNIYQSLLDKIKQGILKDLVRGNIKSLVEADEPECAKILLDGYERSKQAFRYDIKDAIGQECMADWRNWDNAGLVERDPIVLAQFREKLEDKILFHKYAQFIFNEQEKNMKEFANSNGIAIEGDIPFYVSTISCETWVYKDKIFRLDPKNRYQQMADSGAPPDQYDREYGQNWGGTPYYINAAFKQFFYKRTKHELKNADGIRIDHFRALNDFWVIPHGKLGRDGKFEDGPKDELLQPLLNLALGQFKRFFAEDLGSYLEGVWDLMRDNEVKGFRVAIFGHGDDDDIVHRQYSGQIAFSGTHDTQTWFGAWNQWDSVKRRIFLDRFTHDDIPEIWQRLTSEQRKGFLKYLNYLVKQLKADTANINKHSEFQSESKDFFTENNFKTQLKKVRVITRSLVDLEELPFGVQTAVFGILAFSEADTVFLPMQDIFRQGEEFRINVPGRPGDWGYRHPYTGQELNKAINEEIKKADELMRLLAQTSGRDVSVPLYKKGQGVHILGVSPGVNAKKMCKPGEEFIIWAAVQGDKPAKVNLLTNMPEHNGAYPKEQAVAMELVKELKSGTYLYGVRIRATQPGKWGVAVEADNVRAGEVKENTSLVVSALDKIAPLAKEQEAVLRIAAGISKEKLQRILNELNPDLAQALRQALKNYQVEYAGNDEEKIINPSGLDKDLLYANVNLIREKLLNLDYQQLIKENYPALNNKLIAEYMNRSGWYSAAVPNKIAQTLLNIAVLPGNPESVMESLTTILGHDNTISGEKRVLLDQAFANAAAIAHDSVFRKGDLFVLNKFNDPEANQKVLSFARYMGNGRKAMVISNFNDSRINGTLLLNQHNFDKIFNISSTPGSYYALIDRVSGEIYLREGKDLIAHGLYFDLPAQSTHVFMVQSLQDNTANVLRSKCNYYNGKSLPLEEILSLLNNFGLTLDFPCVGKTARAFVLQGLLNNVPANQLIQAFKNNPEIKIIEFGLNPAEIAAEISKLAQEYQADKQVQALCQGLRFLNQRGALNEINLVLVLNQDKTSVEAVQYFDHGSKSRKSYLYVNLSRLNLDSNNNSETKLSAALIIGARISRQGSIADYELSRTLKAFLALWARDDATLPGLIDSEHKRIKGMLEYLETNLNSVIDEWKLPFHYNLGHDTLLSHSLRRVVMDLFLKQNTDNQVSLATVHNFAYFLAYYLADSGQADKLRDILLQGFSGKKASFYEQYFLTSFISGALVLRDSSIDAIFIDLLENPLPQTDLALREKIIKTMCGLNRFDLKLNKISVKELGAVLQSGKAIESLPEATVAIRQYQAIGQAI